MPLVTALNDAFTLDTWVMLTVDGLSDAYP